MTSYQSIRFRTGQIRIKRIEEASWRPLLWNLPDASKTEPVCTVARVFWGPSGTRPNKRGPTEEASPFHQRHLFNPCTFTHLPHVSRHFTATIGACPFAETSDRRGSPDPELCRVAATRIEIIPPRPPKPVHTTSGLLPLRLRWKFFPSPYAIGSCIVPTQPHYRLIRITPPWLLPQQRFSMTRFNKKPIVLRIGNRIFVNVVGIRMDLAGWNLRRKNGILFSIQSKYLDQFLPVNPHGERPFRDEDHNGVITR